jgi:hypothetical protein
MTTNENEYPALKLDLSNRELLGCAAPSIALGYDVLGKSWDMPIVSNLGGAVGTVLSVLYAASDDEGLTAPEVVGIGVGLSTGATLTRAAVGVSPVGAGITAYMVAYKVEQAITNLVQSLLELEDPDGGVNGKNAMVPGYLGYGVPMPLDILRSMQEGIGLGDMGVTLTVGNEFNALDLISEMIRLGQMPQIPENDAELDGKQGESASETIRRAGNAIDNLLDQGGAVPGAIGNVIKVGANALAGAVDAGVNLFEQALDAAAAAHQREYNRDRQGGDSWFNRNGGSGSGSAHAGHNTGSTGSGNASHSSTVTGHTTSQTTYTSGGTTHTVTHVTGGGGGGADSGRAANPPVDRTATEGRRPILLDLDGNGVKITEYQNSTQFQTGKNGLSHRTSWAGTGDGFLFYDAGIDNLITEEREYVFTEWNPTASGDLEALRSVWDTNGDGKLTAADAAGGQVTKVIPTQTGGNRTLPRRLRSARPRRAIGDWRTVRDSNPRDGSPPTHFPGVRLRPLGQLSVGG